MYIRVPDSNGLTAIAELSGSTAEKPRKVIRNGCLVIQENNIQYNVQGQQLQ